MESWEDPYAAVPSPLHRVFSSHSDIIYCNDSIYTLIMHTKSVNHFVDAETIQLFRVKFCKSTINILAVIGQ